MERLENTIHDGTLKEIVRLNESVKEIVRRAASGETALPALDMSRLNALLNEDLKPHMFTKDSFAAYQGFLQLVQQRHIEDDINATQKQVDSLCRQLEGAKDGLVTARTTPIRRDMNTRWGIWSMGICPPSTGRKRTSASAITF